MLFTSCMIIPYYKKMPYLPAVQGTIIDKQTKNVIYSAKIYWKDESSDYSTLSDEMGHFQMNVIEKFITWKLVAMDPGWGGTLVIESQNYKSIEKKIGGPYNPSHIYDIEIELEKEEK